MLSSEPYSPSGLSGQAQHVEVYKLVCDMVKMALSNKWTLVNSKAEAIRVGAMRASSGNDAEFMAFVTEAEQVGEQDSESLCRCM